MIWTRALVLEAMGFDFVRDSRHALKRVRQARNARTSDDRPDHRLRLEAAKLTFDLAGVKAPEEIAPSQQTNVTIVWDLRAVEVSPPTSGRMALSSTASSGSNDSPSSSVIEDGERPPSA